MRVDVNWFGVLEHHAARAPDRAITRFEARVLPGFGLHSGVRNGHRPEGGHVVHRR